MKNKTKFLLTTLFILIAFLLLGTTKVSAVTVTVTTEEQLRNAVDGVKEVEGVEVTDTDTTEVKLGTDIVLTNYLEISPSTDFALDLCGYTIDGVTESNNDFSLIGISYGDNGMQKLNSGSITVKDSSASKTGTIKTYGSIGINNYNTQTTAKHFKLIIENGKFYNLDDSAIFQLANYEIYMKNKNVKFDFQVKDGYFEVIRNRNALLQANDIITNNVTLNVNFDKLTLKGTLSRLMSSNTNFTMDNVVSTDSNIKIKDSDNSAEFALTDRTVSATAADGILDAISPSMFNYDTIEITKAEGFDVSDVPLNETYGYTTAKRVAIPIKNRGTNPLKIKNVSVSSANFKTRGSPVLIERPTVAAGATDNTSYTIEAMPELNAGTYTAIITVTDENDKTYTSTVTLTVGRKPLGDISVSKDGWTYDGTVHTGYTKSGLDSVPSDKYLIEYSVKDANSWSTTVPKTAGNYTIRLTITDSNLEEKSAESDFTIAKNNKEIQIIANSHEWTYDSHYQMDEGYTVKYDGTVITDGVLPTGDTISAMIVGSVKDVKDTVTGNNEVREVNIQNRDSYSNVTTTNGTLTINPITTPIIVTAGSATKAYDGSALTKDSYTFTNGIVKMGDTLKATITGSRTYVGTISNTVSDVKVMRGKADISDNYTFGTHVNGTLEVTAIDQPLSIADQYVRVNGTLFTSELEAALTGAKSNVSFEKKSGTAGEYNNETIGGFLAGSSEGTVIMTVKATAFDVDSDGTAEYNATEKDFNIHVVIKETVTISGITDNQEFTYNGIAYKPVGTIIVTDNKVSVSELEVSYVGTGSTVYNSKNPPSEAGTYQVTYKVPNTNADYVGEAAFNFIINKAKLPKVTLKQTSYEYTNDTIMTDPNNYDMNKMSYSGDISAKNVGSYTLTISLKEETKKNYEWTDGTTSNLPLNWSIIKADPDFDIPTNLTGLKGQTLNEISLPDRFTWNNASTSLIVGTHTYKATYTPSDTDNYNIMNNIDITIVTKDIFNVTISVVGSNGTISTSYSNVVEGSTKEITLTPNTGFMIDKVLVNDVDKTDEMVGDILTLNNITANIEIKVVVEKIDYEVIEGANQEYTITKDTEAKFRIDAEYGLFMQGGKVYVDDELVDEDNYTTKEGSTVVILKQAYVDTLSVGKHTLKVTFADGGEATTNFKIARVEEQTTPDDNQTVDADNNTNTEKKEEIKEEDKGSNPKTFDNIIVYVAIAIMSVVGLVATVIIKKKQIK